MSTHINRRTLLKGLVAGATMVALTTACTPEQRAGTMRDVADAGTNYTGAKGNDIDAHGNPYQKDAEDALDAEDPPKYNCLTKGDGVCGYRYHSLPNNIRLQLLQDKLIDDTTACRIRWGNTSKIVCDNGLVTTS